MTPRMVRILGVNTPPKVPNPVGCVDEELPVERLFDGGLGLLLLELLNA